MRERRRKAGLKLMARWVPAVPSAIPSDHRWHDLRSLAMHALIAAKIERDPRLLDAARRNLANWRSRFAGEPAHWWREWDRLLRGPWSAVVPTLLDPGEDATRLRQSSPFAGILNARQRQKIYDAFRA